MKLNYYNENIQFNKNTNHHKKLGKTASHQHYPWWSLIAQKSCGVVVFKYPKLFRISLHPKNTEITGAARKILIWNLVTCQELWKCLFIYFFVCEFRRRRVSPSSMQWRNAPMGCTLRSSMMENVCRSIRTETASATSVVASNQCCHTRFVLLHIHTQHMVAQPLVRQHSTSAQVCVPNVWTHSYPVHYPFQSTKCSCELCTQHTSQYTAEEKKTKHWGTN